MTDRTTLAVMFGGKSGEHDVSLRSARSVLSVLSSEKYRVIPIGISEAGTWYIHPADLESEQPSFHTLQALADDDFSQLKMVTLVTKADDRWLYLLSEQEGGSLLEPLAQLDVVFPVLHGTFGEDGTMQGLFEIAGLAYVGAGVLGSAVGMDKALFKKVMQANNLPIVESHLTTRFLVENQMADVIDAAEKVSPYPLFTKPANLGSSVGITKCRTRSELMEGLMDAASFDRRVLVERGVNCRELEISVLGNENPQASVVGEVIPSDEFYTYNAKYIDGKSVLLIPAPIPAELLEYIQQLAIKVYKAIDCAGMARVDMMLDKDTGTVFVNEVNTIPGFTDISMYSKLWEASGLSYTQLVQRLIDLAIERKQDNDRTVRVYGSVS